LNIYIAPFKLSTERVLSVLMLSHYELQVWQCQLDLAQTYVIDLCQRNLAQDSGLFALLRVGCGGSFCQYSDYSEPHILCGGP